MNQPDENGRTPLMYAVSSGWQHVVEFLLQRGVDTSMTDDRHTTALMQACSLGHPTIVRLLLDTGASVDDVCLVISSCALKSLWPFRCYREWGHEPQKLCGCISTHLAIPRNLSICWYMGTARHS